VIDHLHNPNDAIGKTMEGFFRKTYSPPKTTDRDTSLGQASKEMERQQLKLLQINRRMRSIGAYQEEHRQKIDFFAYIKKKYPLIEFEEHNLHNYNFDEVKRIIASRIEAARMLQAAIKIQRSYRYNTQRKREYREWLRKDTAARMIQKNYKASVWVRVMNRLSRKRKEAMARRVQQFLRGHLAWKQAMQMKRDAHLRDNFAFFEGIREQFLIDAQIKIRWAWRLKQRRKTIRLQKKREAEEAKNARLYGRAKKKPKR